MTRIAAMNVQVTASTKRFDDAMQRVRANVRRTQGQIGGAAGGALSAGGIGGGFGAGAGMMLRGSPLLAAIGGLTMALEAQKRTTEEGRQDTAEMALLGLSPTRQAEAKAASQLLGGEGAGDLMAVKQAFEGSDRTRDRGLMRQGMTQEQIDRLNTSSISQFTEDLVKLSRSMSEAQRIAVAEQLGGKAGEMFLRAGAVQQDALPDISNAIQQTGVQEAARALSIQQQDQAAALEGAGLTDVLTGLWDWLTGQDAKTAETEAVLLAELQKQTQLMGNPTGPTI